MLRTKTLIIIALLVLVAGGALAWVLWPSAPEQQPVVMEEPVEIDPRIKTIGASVEGRDIEAYAFGSGDTELLFVGGIHGGYEWNTVVLAYELIDHLEARPEAIPENITVHVVPSLNPDGVYSIIQKEGRFTPEDVPVGVETAPGRFNANEVDLNRNFACDWQPESTWRSNVVSAGTSAFSEPETRAIRDYIAEIDAEMVVFWHSASNAVYASQCGDGILPETLDIMNVYADAAGYRTFETFDHYTITGDASDWLSTLGIPSVAVELETHENVEWERNKKGIEAVLNYYAN